MKMGPICQPLRPSGLITHLPTLPTGPGPDRGRGRQVCNLRFRDFPGTSWYFPNSVPKFHHLFFTYQSTLSRGGFL
jgi:hypothetical protein